MNLLGVLATLSMTTTRRVFEIGFLLGAIGALGLAAGQLPRLGRSNAWLVVGALLLALGLALAIIAIHFGRSPWSS